jgi:hypothetical protein
LIASPLDPNRVISDVTQALSLPGAADTATVRLAQDVPDIGLILQPTAEETYRRLLDKGAISGNSSFPLSPGQITRANIALTAEDYIGSTRWSYDTTDPRTLAMGYPLGTNKCNLFVAQILGWNSVDVGFPNKGQYFSHPPKPSQWADLSYAIPGWMVLGVGAKPEPGDIAAQSASFSDASGHVMIVGTGNTLVGTVDIPNIEPQGVVARIGMKQNIVPIDLAKGPIVFRRYTGN